VKVRELEVSIETEYLRCNDCQGEFDDPSSEFDKMATAYAEYKKIKGFLQSTEIKEFRNSLRLTQKELCGLLGWGDVTLSRYENGHIQDESHDKSLRMAMTSDGMSVLLRTASKGLLSDAKKHQIERYFHQFRFLQNRSEQRASTVRVITDASGWKRPQKSHHEHQHYLSSEVFQVPEMGSISDELSYGNCN
jgi:putative zinc finger/helix-turn-helix YgiT family protein